MIRARTATESLACLLLGILYAWPVNAPPPISSTIESQPVAASFERVSKSPSPEITWPSLPGRLEIGDISRLLDGMNDDLQNVELIAWRLQAFVPDELLRFLSDPKGNSRETDRLRLAVGFLFLKNHDRLHLKALLRDKAVASQLGVEILRLACKGDESQCKLVSAVILEMHGKELLSALLENLRSKGDLLNPASKRYLKKEYGLEFENSGRDQAISCGADITNFVQLRHGLTEVERNKLDKHWCRMFPKAALGALAEPELDNTVKEGLINQLRENNRLGDVDESVLRQAFPGLTLDQKLKLLAPLDAPVDTLQRIIGDNNPAIQGAIADKKYFLLAYDSSFSVALAAIEQEMSTELKSAARGNLVKNWAEADPNAAANHVYNNSEISEREELMGQILSIWKAQDPATAAEWENAVGQNPEN